MKKPVPDIAGLLAAGKLIKDNGLREVRNCGDFFLKLDKRRRPHSFRWEYSHALQLLEAGFDTAAPASYGSLTDAAGAKTTFLVTCAIEKPLDLKTALLSPLYDCLVLNRLRELVVRLSAAGFVHGDFHPGNLLYQPETGRLYLVDVRDVHRVCFFPFYRTRLRRNAGIFFRLREFFPESRLELLLEAAGVRDIGSFWEDAYRQSAGSLRRIWKRRVRQILTGYAKFTRCSGGVLTDSSASDAEAADAVAAPGGLKLFLAHFLLTLAGAPHRRVLRYDAVADQAFVEPEPAVTFPADDAELRSRRLRDFYGIVTRRSHWRRPAGSPVSVLTNLAGAMAVIGTDAYPLLPDLPAILKHLQTPEESDDR